MDFALTVGLVLLTTLSVMILFGVPIAVSIGASAAIAMVMILPFQPAMITSAQRVFTGINTFALIAIPLFILAGNIMNNGGIAIKLINCAKVLTGHMPASLSQTNVLANILFGAISGSGAAAAAAVGGTIAPLQKKEGYDPNFAAAVNIASAPTGLLIPPSNTLIVYSSVAGSVSISALFLAGYVPGLLWGFSVMVLVWFLAKKRGYTSAQKVDFKTAVYTILDAVPALSLIVIVIGGILAGVFTATEGSAIAVIYSLILSIFYKSITLKQLKEIILVSSKTTAIVILMVGVSTIMSWVLSYTHIPEIIAQTLLSISSNKYIILIIINLVLLFVGTFMDPTPAILIFTPIFLPVCKSFEMSPIHFGIMITMNLCIGLITPPVGNILYVGCKVGNVAIESVVKSLLAFFAVIAVTLLLTTYIPQISLALPTWFGLIK